MISFLKSSRMSNYSERNTADDLKVCGVWVGNLLYLMSGEAL